MAKEVMAFTESDIKNMTLTVSEFDTLKFLAAHSGVEMDEGAQQEFVAQRNARIGEITAIAELKAKAEKLADYLKTVLKHSFNVGSDEDLPKNVSWSKQSYTYEFEEGQAHVIANNLIECGLIANKEQLFDCVTVSAMQKAAGITMDKMLELYHDGIVIKPKERTLKIK